MSSLAGFWKLVFPARCVGCGRRGIALCGPCLSALPYLPAAVCPRCATPSRTLNGCRVCARLTPALVRVQAVCSYEQAARAAVHALKFRSGRYLAAEIGALLRAEVTRHPVTADYVIPAPLAPRRQRERGYNQAALLAREISPLVGPLWEDALERGDRPPQQRLRAAERRTNLRGTVACNHPVQIRGKRILLVDDVMTTGSTLGACADALNAAGATRVAALVFARDL